jgi:hypothetical protein
MIEMIGKNPVSFRITREPEVQQESIFHIIKNVHADA